MKRCLCRAIGNDQQGRSFEETAWAWHQESGAFGLVAVNQDAFDNVRAEYSINANGPMSYEAACADCLSVTPDFAPNARQRALLQKAGFELINEGEIPATGLDWMRENDPVLSKETCWRVLVVLDLLGCGLSQNDIVDRAHVSKTTVGEILDELVGRGLVERLSPRYQITQRGREALSRRRQGHQEAI
jgi:hypothetical protein